MSELPLTGGCLCGAVRFTLYEPPTGAAYCHCTRCQRRTGTAASPSAQVDSSALEIVNDEALLTGWRHPDGGSEKLFCAGCGAHLFARNPDHPERTAVRMSAFDSDPGVRPSCHQFVAYAAAWEPIPDDGLERFAEARPA